MKIDELKQIIKVMEGQNGKMMQQLIKKDHVIAQCQKKIMDNHEQLKSLQNQFDKIGFFNNQKQDIVFLRENNIKRMYLNVFFKCITGALNLECCA